MIPVAAGSAMPLLMRLSAPSVIPLLPGVRKAEEKMKVVKLLEILNPQTFQYGHVPYES
jgi:hypothetical protein